MSCCHVIRPYIVMDAVYLVENMIIQYVEVNIKTALWSACVWLVVSVMRLNKMQCCCFYDKFLDNKHQNLLSANYSGKQSIILFNLAN